ncbi:MAG: hypothetical protein ACI81L_000467 [Verrucomicrobiales bacterium]|jgi:hypothetical protein
MTEGDRDNSGELSSFLHLTGWRPLVLALVAGLAGAVGLFGALNAPAEFQARYIVNAERVADDDLTPQEKDIFVDEIVQTAKLPQVEFSVQELTGLIVEDDYDITINQSGSSITIIDINVVSGRAEDAQIVARDTGIVALDITLEMILGGFEASAASLETRIGADEARIRDLTVAAGGINPSVAYGIAVQDVIDRRVFLENPPSEPCALADGTPGTCLVPEPSPSLDVLEERAAEFAPLEREYTTLIAAVDSANLQLADRRDSIRDANVALELIAGERDQSVIINEVVTEETSRIAGLLTGLLLFAIPAALLVILLFTIYDALRKKPDQPLRRAEDFSPTGILEAQGQRALPEASITSLVVVDEGETSIIETDARHENMAQGAQDHDDGSDPDAGEKKRSKDGRWGRDASSKAG